MISALEDINVKKCINCNASIGDNLKFCPYCHKKQKNSTSGNPFEKYTERTSNPEYSEELSNLHLYGKRQKLFNILFFISLLIELMISISSNILPINNIKEILSYIAITLVFINLFTFFLSFIYRKKYNTLNNKLHLSSKDKTDFTAPTQATPLPTVNYIVGGKYINEPITCAAMLYTNSSPYFNKYSISSYTVLDASNKDSYEFSFWKGALGVVLFGDIGVIAGIGGQKSDEQYLIAIEWKDGEKSLILINDEYYKVFVKSMF